VFGFCFPTRFCKLSIRCSVPCFPRPSLATRKGPAGCGKLERLQVGSSQFSWRAGLDILKQRAVALFGLEHGGAHSRQSHAPFIWPAAALSTRAISNFPSFLALRSSVAARKATQHAQQAQPSQAQPDSTPAASQQKPASSQPASPLNPSPTKPLTVGPSKLDMSCCSLSRVTQTRFLI